MKSPLKKLLPLAGVIGCLSSSLLLAATQYGGHDSGSCCPPPKKPDPCNPCDPCNEVLDRTRVFAGCDYREITPCAGPRVACGADLFVTVDFIYWRSGMDGLAYATTGNGANIAPANPGTGSVRHPDFGWDPGFKIGLGYNLGHDCWDIFAEYTYLRPSASDSVSNTAQTLVSLWSFDNVNTTPLASARGSWDLDFNVVDLELGRNYFISRYLTLRPHFGLKGTWMCNDFATSNVDFADNTIVNRFTVGQDYWAVGLRTGLDTVWYFNKYFGIFGDFALSAIWGEFDVTRRERATTAGVITSQSNYNNDFYSLKEVFEIVLGLQGDIWFSDDSFHLGFNAGWEMQYWPDQNQYFKLSEEAAHGDLFFMGLTLGVRFDF